MIEYVLRGNKIMEHVRRREVCVQCLDYLIGLLYVLSNWSGFECACLLSNQTSLGNTMDRQRYASGHH